MKKEKILFILLFLLTIISTFPESKNNSEILNVLIHSIKEAMPLAFLILLILYKNKDTDHETQVKYLKETIRFTENNMTYFKEEYMKLKDEKSKKEEKKESVRKFSGSIQSIRADETKIKSILFIFRKNKLPITSTLVNI